MAIDVKGLLQRSQTPGTTFGELAGLYLQGGRKKDNRARNLLIGSLFFNAAEASRQSKVLDKLQRQEVDNKMIESKLAAQFEKQMELINTEKEIKKLGLNGQYAFYDADAEIAFDQAVESGKLAKLFGPEGGLEEGDKIKRKWKRNWIDTNSYADHKAQMVNIDVKTAPRTLEAFSKEAKDYMYAVNKNITKPQDMSLVHDAFRKIGIGKSDKEYNDEVLEAKRKYDESQAKIDSFYRYEYGQNVVPPSVDDIGNKRVTAGYVSNEFDKLGIADAVLKQKFFKDVAEDGQTVNAVLNNLSAYTLKSNEKKLEAINENATQEVYEMYGVTSKEQFDKLIESGKISAVRAQGILRTKRMTALGIVDKVGDTISLAEQWIDVLQQVKGLSDEESEKLKRNWFNKVVREEFLDPDDEALLKASEGIFSYEVSKIMEDQDLYRRGDDGMLEAISTTQLTKNDIALLNQQLKTQGDKGKAIINQLQQAEYQLTSPMLDEDSIAYRILEEAMAEKYFSWRYKQASVVMSDFNRSGSIFVKNPIDDIIDPPTFNDSLNLGSRPRDNVRSRNKQD